MNGTRLALCALCVWCCAAAAVQAAPPADDNLLPNPGFEAPAAAEGVLPLDWDYYSTRVRTLALVAGKGRSGTQCARLRPQQIKEQGQGLIQRLPVEPGTKYTFNAFVRRCDEDPLEGGAFGQLVIEWKSAKDVEIKRDSSGMWGQGLSWMRWERIGIKRVKAPPGAVGAVFGIHLYEGDGTGKGAVLIDDVELLKD